MTYHVTHISVAGYIDACMNAYTCRCDDMYMHACRVCACRHVAVDDAGGATSARAHDACGPLTMIGIGCAGAVAGTLSHRLSSSVSSETMPVQVAQWCDEVAQGMAGLALPRPLLSFASKQPGQALCCPACSPRAGQGRAGQASSRAGQARAGPGDDRSARRQLFQGSQKRKKKQSRSTGGCFFYTSLAVVRHPRPAPHPAPSSPRPWMLALERGLSLDRDVDGRCGVTSRPGANG